MKCIIVTTGDIDGIGLEVFSKAALELNIHHTVPLIFFLHNSQKTDPYFFTLKSISSPLSGLLLPSKPGLFYIESQLSPTLWVQEAAQFCYNNPTECILVTGPLDKNTIVQAGIQALGHTEILADICHVPRHHLLMLFIGHYFNVVCLTGHIAISDVEKALDKDTITKKIDVFYDWIARFNFFEQMGRIGVLGLNPHSSDRGLIGNFEQSVLYPALKKVTQLLDREAIVPDSAFIDFQSKLEYNTFIAMYHDQGLIPFKMAHGFTGVHVTVGLPFLRLSVDHGTAKQIFGQDRANFQSMRDCLMLACRRAIE